MNQHLAEWPAAPLVAVEITENDGAWFVSYEGADGHRLRVLKRNGRPKGFRSLDKLVPFLRFVHGVEKMGLTAQLPRR